MGSERSALYWKYVYLVAISFLVYTSGCRPSHLGLMDANSGLIGRRIDGKSIQGINEIQTRFLRYNGRGMELEVRRFGRVDLEDKSQISEKNKRVVMETLAATFDLSPIQWRAVFAAWFAREIGVREIRNWHATEVKVGKRSAWLYTGAKVLEAHQGSHYWRVYLLPCGRTATILRSMNWQEGDGTRYGSLLDDLLVEVNAQN